MEQTKHGWKEEDGRFVYYQLIGEPFLDAIKKALQRASLFPDEKVAIGSHFDLVIAVESWQDSGSVEKRWYSTLQNFCRPYQEAIRESGLTERC